LPGHSGNPHGYAIRQIRRLEYAVERDALAAELEADLGRLPTRRERLLIEAAAAAAIEARKLRKQGRSSIEHDRLVCRTLRALGLEAEAPAPATTLRAYLQARTNGES
jgi:hypothetical protein